MKDIDIVWCIALLSWALSTQDVTVYNSVKSEIEEIYNILLPKKLFSNMFLTEGFEFHRQNLKELFKHRRDI